jgi:hypothetical protein
VRRLQHGGRRLLLRACERPSLERCDRDDPRGGLLEYRPEPIGVPFWPAVPHNHLDIGHTACLRRAVSGPRHGCAARSAPPTRSRSLDRRWELQEQHERCGSRLPQLPCARASPSTVRYRPELEHATISTTVYAAPAASTATANAVSSGTGTFTISGLNFGASSPTATASLTTVDVCGSTAWTSATTVACAPRAYGGSRVRTTVSVSALVGTLTGRFSFDNAVASDMRRNSPHSGHASLTVFGLNFGVADRTMTTGLEQGVQGDLGVCFTSSWSSATTVACRSNPLGVIFGQGSVTVASVSGTSRPIFSFDSAIASSVELNMPLSGQILVTVSGLNFGVGEHTASAGLEMGGVANVGSCSTSSWTSATSAACRTVGTSDKFGFVQLTVASVAGTGLAVYSFDGAVVSEARRNAPFSGYASVTVSGLNFGVSEHTATAGLNGAGRGDVGLCFSASWTSATTLACLSNESRNILIVASATVAVVSGTGQLIFSFDGALPFTHHELPCEIVASAAPVVSKVAANAVSSGSGTVTMSGLSFVTVDPTATGTLATADVCVSSAWTSATTVACASRACSGSAVRIAVSVGAVVSTVAGQFSFDGARAEVGYRPLEPSPRSSMGSVCSGLLLQLRSCLRHNV